MEELRLTEREREQALEGYREVLKNGYLVMTASDACSDSFREFCDQVRALAEQDGLKTVLMWDQFHFGNIADLCPIIELASRNGGACYDPMDGGCRNLLSTATSDWGDILADARRRHGIGHPTFP